MMKSKVLFVSHDASRTGAPIVFLTLLKWLKNNTNIELTILLKDGGPLEEDFREVAETFIWKPNTKLTFTEFKDRLVRQVNLRFFKKEAYKPFPDKLKRTNFDLVYFNTVASLDLVPLLKKNYNTPIIAHVHENEFTINNFYPNSLDKSISEHINFFIAVSEDTKVNLINNFNIPESKISLFYEFIDVAIIKKPSKPKNVIQEELELNGNFIIGGSGITSWRKGADLFVILAAYIKRNYPDLNIKFVWVGAIERTFKIQLEYELKRYGIQRDVIFTDRKSDPNNYFQVFDLFLLTSREDPFPLVCLEAAALGKPIICFNQSGGMVEFVSLGSGSIITYGSIEQITAKIIELKNNSKKRHEIGLKAKESIQKFDVNVIAPEIYNFITTCIKYQ